MSFTPIESAVFRLLDQRVYPYTCRSRDEAKRRSSILDEIAVWAKATFWFFSAERRAYDKLIPYFRNELRRRALEWEREQEVHSIKEMMPTPPEELTF